MSTLESITIEADDTGAVERFVTSLGVADRVAVRPAESPTQGFRGFTLSVTAAQPADVDALIARAVEAGGTAVKPASKSLWGYGGAVQAPDGTAWTFASSSKKDTGPATGEVESLVLLLGVEDVKASRQFYTERGLSVAKSFGGKYAEFEADGSPVSLALNKRRDLAKAAGVSEEGSGSHRLVVHSPIGPFTDPDGFVWEQPAGGSPA